MLKRLIFAHTSTEAEGDGTVARESSRSLSAGRGRAVSRVSPRNRVPPAFAGGLAVLLSLLVAVSPASAQEASFTVTPLGGSVFPASDLIAPITVDTLGVDRQVTLQLENQFAPGLRLGRTLSDHVSVEAGFHFASTEIGFDPTPLGFDADLLIAGGGGRYRFLPSATVSPFLGAGAGVKHLDLALFADETDLMWNVGGGALFETGWVADVRVEVRDYMSTFGDADDAESNLQHDLWAGVGLEFGVF